MGVVSETKWLPGDQQQEVKKPKNQRILGQLLFLLVSIYCYLIIRNFKIGQGAVVCTEAQLTGDITIGRCEKIILGS